MSALVRPRTPAATLVVRGAHVLDPRTGVDGLHDVVVLDGEIAEIGAAGSATAPDGAEVVDGSGRHLLPAFVDPHVHLRVPGQEHKEDLETGTRAAAAGGFCAVVAMPNTDPVVDSAPILRSLRDAAARDARIPVGFMAAITRGLEGEELTEMAELRDQGALGFTDDGKPVTSAGMLRQALQYQRLGGGVIALHEEDPSLSGRGAMHEGEVSALLGIAGIPSVSESTMVARDCALAGYEGGRIHMQHLSALESVERRRARQGRRRPGHLRGLPAPPLPHRRGGPRPRHADEDEPAAAHRGRPPGADRGPAQRRRSTASPPTTRRTRATRRRSRSSRRRWARPGWRPRSPPSTPSSSCPGSCSLGCVVERMTAGGEPLDLPAPRIERGAEANLVLVDLGAEWEVGEDGYESRSENCCFAGRTLRGRVLLTVAAGAVAYRERAFSVVSA